MPEEAQICETCKKPKVASSKASLTQWISTCVCDLEPVDSANDVKVEICHRCGKRIGESKKGSLTQFIFRTEYCKCNRPIAILDRKFDFYNPPQLLDEELIEDDNLDVDISKFPSSRYKPLKLLGKGASGVIYLAQDNNLNKKVSLKLLKTAREEHLIAFQEEAKATSKLNHPSIIKIIDFGIANETSPYMVLEYFNGTPLDELIRENGALDWHLAVEIILEICNALNYSHSHGVFHRDIKPGNILVRVESDRIHIRVIDFGVARLIEERADSSTLKNSSGISLVGTPAYMSPDQLNGLEYDSCSEMYSIGCLFFELITGTTPYSENSSKSIIQCHLEESVPHASDRVDLPSKLDSIISKCLSKEKQDRYETANQLKLALTELLDSTSEQEIEPVVIQKSKTKNKSSMILIPLLCFISLAISIGIYSILSNKQNLKESTKEPVIKPAKKTFEQAFKITELKNDIKITAIGNITDNDFELVRGSIKNNTPITIHILGQSIDGSGFKYLSGLPIRSLNIRSCQLKDSNAKYLSNITSLRAVKFTRMKVSDAYLKAFKDIKQLHFLDLQESKFEEKQLESLFKKRSLQKVKLNDTTVSDRAMRYLRNCPNLKELRISSCAKITGQGFKYLVPHKQLNYLEVVGTPGFNKDAIAAAAKYPKLYTLHIGSVVSFKPADLTPLSKSKSLKSLAIFDLKPISSYLKYISKLNNITKLKLNDTDLKEEDFGELLKLKNLKQLVLTANPKINKEATDRLEKLLPKSTTLTPDRYTVEQTIGDVQQLFEH